MAALASSTGCGGKSAFSKYLWAVAALVVVVLPWSSEACETLPSSLHIIKEIYSSTGILERTCEGEVAVSKCEGKCVSKVRPSAVSHSGFHKDCQCCRESSFRLREVTLNKCFDPDGTTLTGEKETYTMQMREPADCKCSKCGESMNPAT